MTSDDHVPGTTIDDINDVELLARFERQDLDASLWTHSAHVRVALLMVQHHGLNGAITRMRSGIKALNAVLNVPEGPHMGYHETVTQAWVRVIHAMWTQQGSDDLRDTRAFLAENTYLLQKKVLRLFYSRDAIMQMAAKSKFVEPDLTPFPTAAH